MARPTLRATHRALGPAQLVVLAVALGCAPPDDDGRVVETEHLRISTTEDRPVCAGTPLWLESNLVRIAETLELPLWPPDDKLDVRFGRDAVVQVCAHLYDEPEQAGGCVTRRDGKVVVAASQVSNTATHELVHAVRRYDEYWSARPFEEGLAEILSGSPGFPQYVTYYPLDEPTIGPVELLEIPREDFTGGYYIPSASFVSWLWEVYGRESVVAFVNDEQLVDTDSILSVFEEHYGLSLAQAEQAWRDHEGPEPVWGSACIPERTHALEGGVVELTGELDCESPEVLGASYFMSAMPMCLQLPENTRVRITFEADHGRVSIQKVDPCEAGPAGGEAYRDKYLDAGETLEEDIVGCTHRVLLHSQEPGIPPTSYSIRVEELDP